MRPPASFRMAALLALLSATPALAAGDAARGAAEFKADCGNCHTATQGGAPRVGPNLWGVFGTAAGTKSGPRASPAMQKSGLTWDTPTLIRYLQAPRRVVPGTQMTFPGVDDAADAADIAAFLETLK